MEALDDVGLYATRRILPDHAQRSSPARPAEFRATYAELEGDLARFERLIETRWDGRRAPVLFSGELLAANAHVGSALIRPGSSPPTGRSPPRFVREG